MRKSVGVAVLAAGKGTRLKMPVPKAIAPILGKKLVDFPIQAAISFAQKNHLDFHIGVVTGHGRMEVENYLESEYSSQLNDNLSFAFQEQQLGTGDALKSYFKHDSKMSEFDYTLILCADTPLITEKELSTLYSAIMQNDALEAVAATFEAMDPYGYGRIKRSKKGFTIIEQKDASTEEQKITEVNSGLYIVKTAYLREQLELLTDSNQAGEFYLTDVFKSDVDVAPILFESAEIFQGVNSLIQLESVAKKLSQRKKQELMQNGVYFIRSESNHIDWDVQISESVTIYPNVELYSGTQIAKGSVIETGAILKNTTLSESVKIKAYSYLEDSLVKSSAQIGPFAHLRPNSQIGEEVKIGNFVEVKKSIFHKGSKASHLSYIGDAEIGENTNIGCGFVTCNYDGKNKHKTVVGKNVFIGSDSQTVAPVTIGNNCFIAAGSTITSDLQDGDFAVARSRQVTKSGLAKKFLK